MSDLWFEPLTTRKSIHYLVGMYTTATLDCEIIYKCYDTPTGFAYEYSNSCVIQSYVCLAWLTNIGREKVTFLNVITATVSG